ncbi:Short C-terminal domain-containing protein [Chryseobacterium arachidis]|uniref:Short C-terminal domain-containing protein n=1 Tax=Chryseobacterium arachidis TaxID=1416778 RepID=A0A1M5BHC1_9FLAO|nr:PH domain-containing protein [Chryseobacterium arachidis]SHF42013.1 Short C-terminal domain-containing protein [Chryseobacterium arachidis]
MNNICGLCGTPLTSMDTLLGENKLADGHVLCNKCLNQATGINKDIVNNLNQFFLPEIRGFILQSKIGESESPAASQTSGFQHTETPSFGFGGIPTRLDEIQDQIVALNARLSVFANAEVKELVNVLEKDERLTAIAEGLTIPGKIEGLIFSTQKRVVFIDKKFFGNVQKDEYLYQNIRSVDHVESLLYSTLKVFTKSGSMAEFKLHNKNDGKTFCNAVNAYLNGSVKQPVPQQQQIQASSFNLYNLPTSENPFQQQSNSAPVQQSSSEVKKESAEVIFDQLEKLGKLREMGVLTEEEFAEQKKKLLERL